MPGIKIRATGSDKFILVNDLLTPLTFGPKEQKTTDPDWPLDVGGFDKTPLNGSIMIKVARNVGGPYSIHDGNKLVTDGRTYRVNDDNLT
jgi:hypothetical protein